MGKRGRFSRCLPSLLPFFLLCLIVTGSARAQQPTPTAEPTPPGFTMPVQPPPGWGAEQWGRMRAACLNIAQKIWTHQPLTPDDFEWREDCLTYSAPPPPSATGKLLPPPPPPLRVPPVSQPTPVPETSPQSSIGGASSNLSGYTAYGFTQDANLSTFSTSAVSPPGESQLLTVFFGPGPEPESSENTDVTFSAPAGAPALSPETPLSNTPAYLAADAGVPPGSSQSFGPYSTSVNTNCSNLASCLWFAWQVAVPE